MHLSVDIPHKIFVFMYETSFSCCNGADDKRLWIAEENFISHFLVVSRW